MKLINRLATVLLIGILSSVGCGGGDIETLRLEGARALEAGDYNYNLGTSYKKFDLLDSAYVYFRRAKILYVRDREINREILDMAPVYGDYEDAINAIAVLIATGDNEKMYWPRLAELHYRNEDMFMTVKYCKLIIADDPELKDYYLYLSRSLSQMSKFEKSNETLLNALEKFGPSAEAYVNIAVNYIAMQNSNKAEEYFRKSLEVNPESIPVWVNLANIYKRFYDMTPPAYKLDSIIPSLEAELSN